MDTGQTRHGVHPYRIHVREPNGWFKPAGGHPIHAHDVDEAAEVWVERVERAGGTPGKFAVESMTCGVFKTYAAKPLQRFEVVNT